MKLVRIETKGDYELDDSIRKLQIDIVQQLLKAKEECLKQVLHDLLNREPTEEDAKKCHLIGYTYWSPNKEMFFYDKVALGTIEHHPMDGLNEGSFYGYTFTPNKEFTNE